MLGIPIISNWSIDLRPGAVGSLAQLWVKFQGGEERLAATKVFSSCCLADNLHRRDLSPKSFSAQIICDFIGRLALPSRRKLRKK